MAASYVWARSPLRSSAPITATSKKKPPVIARPTTASANFLPDKSRPRIQKHPPSNITPTTATNNAGAMNQSPPSATAASPRRKRPRKRMSATTIATATPTTSP